MVLGGTPANAAPATVSADEPTKLCQIDTSTGVWPTGYLATVTIKNTDSVPITWRATLTPSGGASSVKTPWNATFTWTVGGNKYLIDPPLVGTTITPGESWQFGYIGTDSSASLPTVTCLRIR